MKGRKRDIADLLRSGEYRPTRHEHLLPPHCRVAYDKAGGGAAGRQAALDLLDADAEGLNELHRRAYAPASAQLAILYGGSEFKLLPDNSAELHPARQAMWDALQAARAEYAKAVGAPHAAFVIGPPEDAQVAVEWERELWAKILALPDHDPGEFALAESLEAFVRGDADSLSAR